jgi:thiol:disulfide interchange protein
MMKVLLPLATAVLLAFPASAQPGPGVAPAAQAKPSTAAGPGPGIAGTAVQPKPRAPRVYDETADAKADVAAAVAKAKEEKKRVLVTLGANWCGWCRALDRLFTTDEKVAAALSKSYVPVKVDVGRMKKNLDLAATWGADPKKGVPLLVVLDGTGKSVKVQDTEALEAGKGHDAAKVIAFLKANAGS